MAHREDNLEKLATHQPTPRKYKMAYPSIIVLSYMHLAALYGLYLCFTSAKLATIMFGYICLILSEFGITAGAHRLWTHKAYKAKLPLEIALMIMNTLAFQKPATYWVRDHRLHHKHSDTDADPHNASRGFFFSHIGWLLVRKHPEVIRRGQVIEMSDIYNNPVLEFQRKYAIPLIISICFILPTLIPMYCWGESLTHAWHLNILRYIISIHIACLVNSVAHLWGYKPYDKNILPADNILVSLISLGEGFHNYHHVFPWDYRTAELGNNYLNFSTKFIDFFAWVGWAYDLKTVSPEMLKMRCQRTGDVTNVWGWDDKDFPEDLKAAGF